MPCLKERRALRKVSHWCIVLIPLAILVGAAVAVATFALVGLVWLRCCLLLWCLLLVILRRLTGRGELADGQYGAFYDWTLSYSSHCSIDGSWSGFLTRGDSRRAKSSSIVYRDMMRLSASGGSMLSVFCCFLV